MSITKVENILLCWNWLQQILENCFSFASKSKMQLKEKIVYVKVSTKPYLRRSKPSQVFWPKKFVDKGLVEGAQSKTSAKHDEQQQHAVTER